VSLTIYNTLTRATQPFNPMSDGSVSMFVCGPTVYDYSHLGHAKTYTQFDLVARYLRHEGHELRYVQNITDIDDKIIVRAAETGVTPAALAAEYQAAYLTDMAALGNTSVDTYARAHDFVDAIGAQVRRLVETGHAYQLEDGSWYYDVTTFPDYGKLSGRTVLQAEDAVSRIDRGIGKRNAGDFALWKAPKPGEPVWESVIGPGRPGWHIEDTAITEALFGPQYDLHGGASDLIFPHHEAEIAQMEAASGRQPLARYWMHTGLLRVRSGAKMSKSSGNFISVREALTRTDYRTLRYCFLSQHYRSGIEFDEHTLVQARGARERVENFAAHVSSGESSGPEEKSRVAHTRAGFFACLNADFDTPGALAFLFDYIRSANREGWSVTAATWELLLQVNSLLDAFELAESTRSADVGLPDTEIERLVQERERLRAERGFAAADRIRDQLLAEGIVVEDRQAETIWRRGRPA
jgi:cysteinyl-tRNA synthetase